MTPRDGSREDGSAAARDRYRFRAASRHVQPRRRSRYCGCAAVRHDGSGARVEVVEDADGRRAVWWGNVALCGRVTCPVCAARLAARRTRQVTGVLRGDDPAAVWTMLTLTIPHRPGQTVRELVTALLAAWRRVRAHRRIRAIWDAHVTASIRALEVTIGDHGWHPHLHLLLRTDLRAWTLDEDAELRRHWHAATGASLRHGVAWSDPIRAGADSGRARYLAKMGLELAGAGKQRPGARRARPERTRHYWSVLKAAVRGGTEWTRLAARALWADFDDGLHRRRQFELDERAKALELSGSRPEPEPARRWTVYVDPEEFRALGRAERGGLDADATWRVLETALTEPGDPSSAVAAAAAAWATPEAAAAVRARLAARARAEYSLAHDGADAATAA